jgi:hypothetical protein
LLFRKIGQAKESTSGVSRVRSEDNKVLESHATKVRKIPAPLWVQGIGAWEKKETLSNLNSSLSWRFFMHDLGLG